ncbi:MAG: DNA alkylation repair protein [Flavobacteriaceae bacterium]|nr:DNA alkylation repair protein [Flavobacteriaceae bacterium]
MDFIRALQDSFIEHASHSNKCAMEAYMKHKFEFYGIKSPERKMILKKAIKNHKAEVFENCRTIIKKLYLLPQREFHYCAMEIMDEFLKKNYILDDIGLIEFLLITNSHWDSVDFISKHILGNYLLIYVNKTEEVINNFSDSDNIWLHRSAILYQLGYKENTNADILFRECRKHSSSNEFFIQKAIGWALREYAKVNPGSVLKFVKYNSLPSLSRREALKHFN